MGKDGYGGRMKDKIPFGYCHCGCGQKTKISTKNDSYRKWIKGKPKRFINGHNKKLNIGSKNPSWNGGRRKCNGYSVVYSPGHHRANNNGVLEHILIAEKAMGECLPIKAEIHHIDGDKQNNKNNNLVVCQDRAYHMLLHRRQKALKECGYANFRKCAYCGKYDDIKNMYKHTKRYNYWHRECSNRYNSERRLKIWKK
jgi:hypothetical protein